MTIYEDIRRTKSRLIKKVAKKGLYENFGQKEIRKLADKYGKELCENDAFGKMHEAIMEFEQWVLNYEG